MKKIRTLVGLFLVWGILPTLVAQEGPFVQRTPAEYEEALNREYEKRRNAELVLQQMEREKQALADELSRYRAGNTAGSAAGLAKVEGQLAQVQESVNANLLSRDALEAAIARMGVGTDSPEKKRLEKRLAEVHSETDTLMLKLNTLQAKRDELAYSATQAPAVSGGQAADPALVRELQVAQREKQNLESEVAQLRAKLATLSTLPAPSPTPTPSGTADLSDDDPIKAAQLAMQKLREEMTAQLEHTDKLTNRGDSLSDRLAKSEKKASELNTKASNLSARLASALGEREAAVQNEKLLAQKLAETTNDLQQKLSASESVRSEKESELVALRVEAKKAMDLSNSVNAELGVARKERDEIEKKRQTLEQSLGSLQDEYKALDAAKKSIEEELSSTAEKMRRASARLESVQEDLSKTQQERNDLVDALTAEKSSVTNLKADKGRLEEDLEREQVKTSSVQADLSAAQENINSLNSQIALLNATTQNLVRAQTDLESEKKSFETLLAESTSKLNALDARIAEVSSERESVKSELAETTNRLNVKTEEFNQVTEEKQMLDKQIQALQSSLDERESALQSTKLELVKTTEALEAAKSAKLEAGAEMINLQEQLAASEKQRAVLIERQKEMAQNILDMIELLKAKRVGAN